MALLFYSATDHAGDWVAELNRQMPELDVRVWPDTGPVERIRYALVWKPPPGLLAGLPNLEAIFSLGAGVDALLKDATLPDKPLVRMVEPGLTEGMREWVVLQVLYWHRNLHAYRSLQARALWRPLPEKLARERPVGVLGLGELGAACARSLAELGFPVTGWSRTPKTIPGIACRHGEDGLSDVLGRSDILVCLLPLTPETRRILNAGTFARMPRGAVVVNAARGAHLVAEDLLASLDAGHLAGASLDVFEEEPLPPDHPFWHHPAIVVTPHVAAVTHARTATASVVEQIRRHQAGLPLQHLVVRERGY